MACGYSDHSFGGGAPRSNAGLVLVHENARGLDVTRITVAGCRFG